MSVVSLPWHNYPRFKLDDTALLIEVSADAREIIQQKSEAVSLLAQHNGNLVEL